MSKRTFSSKVWSRILFLIVVFFATALALSFSAPGATLAADPPVVDRAAAAFLQRRLQLQDEHGVIPSGAYLKAAAQIKKMRAAQDGASPDIAGIGSGSWSALGPGNIGGRVRSIIPIDANTIFIGSVGGGIWKTTNGGASWSPVDDFMANLAIASMVVNPVTPTTMYAGTGEGFYNFDAIMGAGIFKSVDGGTTWSQLASTNNGYFNWVNRLAFSPDGTVLLAATGSGIWRSTDAGITWSQRTFSRVLQVAFNPGNNSLAIAGTGSGALYSIDGGVGWSAATGLPSPATWIQGRTELGYAPSSASIVYASVDNNSGEVYKSTDGGQSYTLVNTGHSLLGGSGWYSNSIWIDPTNPNILIVGGFGLWRSTDGAASFTNISGSIHPDQHFIVSSPGYSGTSNRRVYVGNDGGIFTAPDIYAASFYPSGWVNLNNNLAITQFYGAAGNAVSGVVIGGSQDNGVDRFDGNLADTNSWTYMYGGDGGFTAADQTDPNYFYSEYVGLAIERSSNGGLGIEYIDGRYWNGSTWAWKSPPYLIPDVQSGKALFIAPFVIDPNDFNRLLAGGVSLWRTNDVKTPNTFTTGPSWAGIKDPNKLASPDAISAIAIAPGNSNVIWVGHTNGDVFMTLNGTAITPTWAQVNTNTPHLPSPRYVNRIAIDPLNTNTVYVAFSGFSSDNIWRTTDGGTTWSPRVGSGLFQLPAAPVFGLAIHPLNPAWIYAATEVGIFASEDAGNTWKLPPDGPANVSTDELQWMGNSLLAATHGRGAYKVTINAPTGGDISIVKSGQKTAFVDRNLAYTLTLVNNGPGDASIVVLTDPLPAGTTIVSMTQLTGPSFFCTTPAVGASGTVSCYVPTLSNGTTATFALTVHLVSAPQNGLLVNTAIASSVTPDANLLNNTSTVTSTVVAKSDKLLFPVVLQSSSGP